MYRRAKAGEVSSPGPIAGGVTADDAKPSSTHRFPPKAKSSSSTTSTSTTSTPMVLATVCVALFCAIMIVNVISPSSVQEAEKSLYNAEHMVQQEVSDFFGGGVHERQVPPIPHSDVAGDDASRQKSSEASNAMLQQDSSWVDGEKKLKQKLKLLAERQAKGLDLGVPVLTRWLGDDIPAWAGEGVNVDEWQKKVDARYAEMREEENKWREKVAEFMETGHATK